VDYSTIRGFNYQPSYARNALEAWEHFDPGVFDLELGRGKRHFPGMNAVRLWLSWDSFKFNDGRFAERFEAALGVAEKHGLAVMPVLLNRWHDARVDFGGIYIDHLLPRASWLQPLEPADLFEPFRQYVEAVVGPHADDPRIFCWDTCNEPFSYWCPPEDLPDIVKLERDWLQRLYDVCKSLRPAAPVSVSSHGGGVKAVKLVEPVSDILLVHPYWGPDSAPPQDDKAFFERSLAQYVAFAAEAGKTLLATETCWGSLDDAVRVEIIHYTLSRLRDHGIGFMPHLLHHTLVADGHRPEYGPAGPAGNMSFIEADGSLRPGHDAFNEY